MASPRSWPYIVTLGMAQQVVKFWKDMLESWRLFEGGDGGRSDIRGGGIFECVIENSMTTRLWMDGYVAFVGVVNVSDRVARYDIWAGPKHVSTISANPGEATLALHDNALPRPCLQYELMTLTASAAPFKTIFAHPPKPNSLIYTWLAQGQWVVSGKFISGGLWDCRHKEAVDLPSYRHAWQTMVLRKRKQMTLILEELMQAACHPSRLEHIGND